MINLFSRKIKSLKSFFWLISLQLDRSWLFHYISTRSILQNFTIYLFHPSNFKSNPVNAFKCYQNISHGTISYRYTTTLHTEEAHHLHTIKGNRKCQQRLASKLSIAMQPACHGFIVLRYGDISTRCRLYTGNFHSSSSNN